MYLAAFMSQNAQTTAIKFRKTSLSYMKRGIT